MAPVAKPQASSTEPSTAQKAGDLLWKFQLRKEHDELLSKLNAHQLELSTFVSDTKTASEKLHARLNAVEKKVEKLDADDRKLAHETGKIRDDLKALDEKMGTALKEGERGLGTRGANKENQHPAAAKAVVPRVPKDAARPRKGPQGPKGKNQTSINVAPGSQRELRSSVQASKNANASKGQPIPSLEPVLPVLPNRETNRAANLSGNQPAPSVDLVPHASSDDTEDLCATPKLHHQPATKPKAVQPDPVNIQTLELPALPRQEALSLKDYISAIDRLAGYITPNTSARAENGFVKGFLDGLKDENHRKILVMTLQENALATVIPSSSGQVNIMVRWKDLKEAVRLSKLLEVKDVTKPGAVAKDVEQVPSRTANVRKAAEIPKAQQKPKKRKKRVLIPDDDEEDM